MQKNFKKLIKLNIFDFTFLGLFLLQFLGLLEMEKGAFGTNIKRYGFNNNVTTYFIFYVLVTILSYFLTYRVCKKVRIQNYLIKRKPSLKKLYFYHYLMIISFFFIILFYFDGIYVLLGQIGKGAYRIQQSGGIGFIRILILNYLLPSTLAYLSINLLEKNELFKYRYFIIISIAFIISQSTGFRASIVFTLMPTLILCLWNKTIKQLIKILPILVFILIGFLILTSFLFGVSTNITDILSILYERVTVLFSEVPWYIFQTVDQKGNIDLYLPTLLYFFGGNIVREVTNVDSFEGLIPYNWSWMITSYIGYPSAVIEKGHSVTATSFGEAWFAGGIAGLIFFGIVGGSILSILKLGIEKSLKKHNYKLASIISVYYVYKIFGWINGGGIASRLDIFTIVMLILLAFYMLVMEHVVKATKMSLQEWSKK